MWNRSTTEQFIEKAKTTHSNNYDYSLVDYKNSLTKVKIICNAHGVFEQTPKIHIKGGGCSICRIESNTKLNKKTQDKFIQESIELYNSYYKYNLVEYKNNKTPVKIICKQHGVFERKPNLFLRGDACRICSKKSTKSSSKDLFIEEAIKIYGEKDDYTQTNILSSKEKIKVRCKKHDYVFQKSIQNYLTGCGCPKCSSETYTKKRTKSTEEFINRSKEVHKDRYDYSNTIYINSRTKLDVLCNFHGLFNQYPQNHIAGNGCPKCAWEEFKNNANGYLREGYIKIAKGRKAIIYLIKCKDDNEEFYKIGKTINKLNKRFIKSNLPYMFEEIVIYEQEADYIFDLETELHKKYKLYSYNPDKVFGGYTECYNLDLPIDNIINSYFN
jgi:hypothetical protein